MMIGLYAVLASLLIYGVGWLAFDVNGQQIFVLLGSVLIIQYFCTTFFAASRFDPRSALISGLSLCLLLRTNSELLLMVTAVVTIASKFVLKWRGKHIFNPTNFGIVVMLALSGIGVAESRFSVPLSRSRGTEMPRF